MEDEGESDGESIQERNRSKILPGELASWEEKAELGDTGAQFEVGQYLLWKAEEDNDEVIACSGVAWLVQAARYGNPEATCLLRQCLRNGRGITAEKRAEMVKLCDEDHLVRMVKHAARHLFQSISPESPTATPAQLIEEIGSKHDSRPGLLLKDDERALLIQLLKSYEGKELAEEDFMLLMQSFAEGRPPSKWDTSSDVETSPTHDDDFSFIEAWHSVKDLFGHALRIGESAGSHSLSAIFPTQQLISLIVLAGFSHISLSSLFLALPLFVCYLALSTMLSVTVQLHQIGPEWQAYSVWNNLLVRLVPDLCALETEARFARRSLSSCLAAIAAGIVATLCLPLANEAWLPRTPLGIVAAISAYIALKSGRAGPDALQVLATITAATVFQALGSLPATWTGVRILRLLGNPIGTLPLGRATLSFGLPAALHVRLLWLLFRNAYRDNWKGLKTALPPLLLVTVWARLSACLLLSSPPSSLVSWLVGPPLLVLSLPMLAISWLFSFITSTTQAIVTMEGVIGLLTLGLVVVALCRPRSWMLLAHLVRGLAELSHNPLLRLGAIWAAVITMAVYLYGDWVLDKAPASSLSWQTYSKLCGPTAWFNTNMAHTQILCSHLQGHKVTWLGRFKYVRITETENGVESLASMLPPALSRRLECLFGDPYPACTNISPGSMLRSPFDYSKSPPKLPDLGFSGWLADKEICLVAPYMQQKCHLKRYDRHKFEVMVGMPKASQRFRKTPRELGRQSSSFRRRPSQAKEDSKDVVLRAGHAFGAWLFSLRRGTILEFGTVLEGRLGSKHPTFELRRPLNKSASLPCS
uniref:Wolframin n=1 Tax=Eptatretus burgeri TaxID=7764 RepID=A0A8C4NJI9_EPTBU